MAKPRPNPRKKVAGNRGFGAEPAGAFDYANRDAERYAVARSNTADDSNPHTVGYAIAPPTATILKRYALLPHSNSYLNRIARVVRPYIVDNIIRIFITIKQTK